MSSQHKEKCTTKPWQYGIRSPEPRKVGKRIYSGFITVRTPSILPEDLDCLIAIWVSVFSRKEGSDKDKYFYQTSLGFRKDVGWHVSAGSTNPQLSCNLHCGPFRVNGAQFKPKPNTVYELGVRFIPQDSGKNKVYLYFAGWSTA